MLISDAVDVQGFRPLAGGLPPGQANLISSNNIQYILELLIQYTGNMKIIFPVNHISSKLTGTMTFAIAAYWKYDFCCQGRGFDSRTGQLFLYCPY